MPRSIIWTTGLPKACEVCVPRAENTGLLRRFVLPLYCLILKSPAVQDLLNTIFVADPAQRATLEEVKAHVWLGGQILPSGVLYNELLQRKR